MKMEDSDKEQARNWIMEHWSGQQQCPICQQSKWALNPMISELRSFQKGQLVVGGPVFPIINLNCSNCGYVLQFSAMQLGIVKVPLPKATENAVTPPNKKEDIDDE